MTTRFLVRAVRALPVTLALSLLALPAATQSVAAPQSGVEEAVRTISAADFAWRVGIIAHDSMQGRDTPSPGLERTADWIASEFRRLGLRGGGDDGGFLQTYPLRSVALDVERSSFSSGSVRLHFGDDLLPLFGTAEGDAVGGLVLVSGTGRVSGSIQRAVRGNHVVLVLSAQATGVDREIFQTLGALRNAGAISVMVTNPVGDARWEAGARRSLQPSVTKGWGDADGGAADFAPLLEIRTAALTRILAGTGVDLSELQARAGESLRSQVVDEAQGTLIQRISTAPASAPNVVGILEGSDPELADEYVVFSGHMDHVGMGTPDENGDSIFNGADDDASGTAAVMEVAQAMASLPTAPRRSTIFLLVSGEEKGLWGSEWFSEHTSIPVEQLVANLNTDMVGRNWADTIVAIGKEHSDLGETLNRVNADHPELRMTAIDDLWPEERFYFRSDHYNFARKGVPVLFFFNGTHDDYHGRDDEPDRIDAEKAARIAKLVFYLGLDIANATERPKWDPASYARIVSDE